MAQTTTAFDAILKELYVGPIRSQLNAKTNLLRAFTKADVTQYKWEGRVMIVPLEKSRNVGTKAVAESGIIPTAGARGTAKLQVPARYNYGRIELTAQVMKHSQTDKGAFTSALQFEQKGLVNDIARKRNRQLAYTGKGTLALANGADTSVTLVVDAPGGVAGSINGVRFLKAGMVIALYKADGSAIDAVRTIASVDSAVQVTLTASATWEDDAIITDGAGSTEGSKDLEPVGLLGIADDSTFLTTIHGIDRSAAANAYFKSTVQASVGTLSRDILQRATDDTEEVSGEVIDQYWGHSSLRREVLKLTEADRRYTQMYLMKPDAGTQAGSFKANLNFNDTPIYIDKDIAYGHLYGINKGHMFWAPSVEGEWADEDGSILGRTVDADSYEARFRVWDNYFSDKGNALLRVDGVTVTVSSGVYAD